MNPEESPERRQGGGEWRVILVMTVVAAVLRFWAFGRLGLTHFDEGVYALAGVWSVTDDGGSGIVPQLVAYAPPGFPILIGLAYRVLGVSDASALFVSVACGVLTIPLAGWLGRRTFGPGGGAAAAAFGALALAHVALSRKALTDVPFLCTWLAALGFGGRFLEGPTFGRALTFGLAAGLAQNFKYNGWICLAIVALAAVFGLVDRDRRRPAAVARTFVLGLLATLIAAVCYVPWYAFVASQTGGYSDLLRHHGTYVGGLASWPSFLAIQLAQVVAFSGGALWAVTSFGVAWACVSLCGSNGNPSHDARWSFTTAPAVAMLLLGAAVAAIPDLAWWVGLAWLPWLAFDPRAGRRVLAAWWLILSLMTPFYHPYARLWLPLHAAGWLQMGGLVVTLCGARNLNAATDTARASMRTRRWLVTAISLGLLLSARALWSSAPPRAFPVGSHFRRTDGLRVCVSEMYSMARRPDESWARLRLLGRCPLLFYLGEYGGLPFRLLQDGRGLTDSPIRAGERALVDDTDFELGGTPVATSAAVEAAWSTVRTWRSRLDPVTLLDVNPSAPFEVYRERAARLSLLAPRHDAPGHEGMPTIPRPETMDSPP